RPLWCRSGGLPCDRDRRDPAEHLHACDPDPSVHHRILALKLRRLRPVLRQPDIHRSLLLDADAFHRFEPGEIEAANRRFELVDADAAAVRADEKALAEHQAELVRATPLRRPLVNEAAAHLPGLLGTAVILFFAFQSGPTGE